MDARRRIIDAFASTPRPPDDRISVPTYDDEGTAEYFRGRTREGHTAKQLRVQSSSLSFFTPEAYRYFLPAYMLAELDDPEEADVIASHIAFDLVRFQERDRPAFSPEELRAIHEFFCVCAARYDNGANFRTFSAAADCIAVWLDGTSGR